MPSFPTQVLGLTEHALFPRRNAYSLRPMNSLGEVIDSGDGMGGHKALVFPPSLLGHSHAKRAPRCFVEVWEKLGHRGGIGHCWLKSFSGPPLLRSGVGAECPNLLMKGLVFPGSQPPQFELLRPLF